MKKVSQKTLLEAAHNLMFDIDEVELEVLTEEYADLLEAIEQMKSITNIDHVKPMVFPYELVTDYLREDVVASCLSQEEALKNASQSEETIIASKKEAASIIAQAKETAEDNKRAMIEETQLEINKMKSLAEEDIARSKEEAKEEIRQEMVSVALAASEEVLKREVNEKDNARIVENFIKDMDK